MPAVLQGRAGEPLMRMVEPTPDGVVLQVRVIPRAGRAGVDGVRDEALLVRLSAAPVDGAANAELIEVLAAAFDVPRRSVAILAGARGRHKRVQIAGVAPAAVSEVIARVASRR